MLRTTKMKLAELMILRQDIDSVLEYLGTHVNFEIQNEIDYGTSEKQNPDKELFNFLQSCRAYLGIEDPMTFLQDTKVPQKTETRRAQFFISETETLKQKILDAIEHHKRVLSAWEEARAFANLKTSYSEIEHLTFLALRIGKIDPTRIDELQFALGDRGIIIPLGEDKSRILAASSKKGRFALDTELKKFGFVALEIPENFTGIPDDVLEGLEAKVNEALAILNALEKEKTEFAITHTDEIQNLLRSLSLGFQIASVREGLEATQMVYRILGWVPEPEIPDLMQSLDNVTEGRIAIRVYKPHEVPSVKKGNEKVPVTYTHGTLVKSFERMIFSYGAPLYGTIDPTPIVAFFFTLLFGIMFGDVGQGAVFTLLGVFLIGGWIKFLNKWKHFGPLFVSIGIASMIMGVLTGEFFANGNVLKPFSRWVTGLFGESQDHILHLMPTQGAMDKLIVFFGFTIAIGFIINSVGLIINIINNFTLGKPAHAIFSKTGICGAFFFWYVVALVVRIFFFGAQLAWFDIVAIVLPLVLLFFAEPFIRLFEGKRPVFENGVFAAAIEGIVEILEVVSTTISNSVSFLRVGAFALAHAVLSYIIFTMTELVGGSLSAGGIAVSIFGNLLIIVLEGLIVAIQVIRLQYYEFFSKFFTETGREFKPLRFTYKGSL